MLQIIYQRKFLLLIPLLALVLAPSVITGQIPNNTWRDHLAYNMGHSVAVTPNKVFCAMTSGGMLSYDKDSGEKQKHSKVTGLSDINISAMAYSDQMEMLVIGYQNGNIDLITKSNSDPINMPDIKRKRIQGLKTIYSITCHENYAFLSCHFGIVHIDLTRMEIKDTYFFGPAASQIKVNDVAIFNDYIFAATELGIYKADLNAPNLVDFTYWTHLNNLPDASGEYAKVEYFNEEVFATYHSATGDKIIRIDEDNNFTSWNPVSDSTIFQITAYNNELAVVTTNETFFFNPSLTETERVYLIQGRDAVRDQNGVIFAAADFLGLHRFDAANPDGVVLSVAGPRFNFTSKVATKDEHVWVGSGSDVKLYTNGAAYNFHNEQWTTLSSGYTLQLDSIGNFFRFAYHPLKENFVYSTAINYGLFAFENYQVVEKYVWENTPVFQNNIPRNVDVRFMGICFDQSANLWAVQNITEQPIFILTSEGEWQHLELKSPLFKTNTRWRDILYTSSGQIWVLSQREGIVVLDVQPDGSIIEKQFSIRTNDGLSFDRAYCIAEDKNGYIWIGTNSGPVIYSGVQRITEQDEVYCSRVIRSRNDGTNDGDVLLDYENVNDIYVDGGNRKWLATESSGLFLVSDDGQKTIHQFTEDNSPIFSNNIVGVGVHEKTGEVFISTSNGLIGFMGQSIEGLDDFTDVYVYPNPVRPGYNGDITVTGLIENANVKFTDISGNMVYETTSLGGQAVWDGKNYNGNRVQTGVYLVFMTNEDGSKTHITKLVFIH